MIIIHKMLCLQPLHQHQHPPDEGGPVHQTHQEAELHGGEGGLDGSLHKQGQPGKRSSNALRMSAGEAAPQLLTRAQISTQGIVLVRWIFLLV